MLSSSTNVTVTYRYQSASAWLLGLVIATTGCASGPDEPSPGDQETVTVKEPLWKKSGVTLWPGEVPVCFDPAVPFPTRTLVQNAITNSWMRVANVAFDGFGTAGSFDCRSILGKVVVSTDSSFSPGQGLTSFTGFPGANSSTSVKIALNNPTQRAVIHEFGHVLGFISESVAVFPLSTCFQRTSGGTQLTPFDEPSSIMAENGCNSATVLSPLDIVGAQVAYGERLTGSAVGLNSQCLEASGMPAGTATHYFHCRSTTLQRWRRDTDRHLFIPGLSDGFLDVQGGIIVNNAVVQTFTQNVPTSVNQQWSLDNVSVVGLGGKCADVPNAAFANGTQLQIFTCNGGNNQKWSVDPDGTVRNGGFCWDVPNAQNTDGTILQIFACNGGSNQKFVFTSSGQMTFGGKCVDVAGGLPNDHAQLQLFTCKAASDTSRFNQRFHVSGPITVGGACLDIPNANTSENVAAQIFSCNGGSNQTWDFYPGL